VEVGVMIKKVISFGFAKTNGLIYGDKMDTSISKLESLELIHGLLAVCLT
jgi:hypothetical protein